MRIAAPLFDLEDSPNASRERAQTLAKNIIERYRSQMKSWGYALPLESTEIDSQEETLSADEGKERNRSALIKPPLGR
jgi:hypothetical protein